MTILYNCRHAGDQYRITKFDDYMNVESSYLCTERECECPAGHRPMCRHREMLPKFIGRKTINTDWFLDYGRGGWVQMDIDPTIDPLPGPEIPPPAIEGVTMLTLDDPREVHNAIAEAVGEPEAILPAPRRYRRR